ncbi:MAG: Gfo/Idh/MocA family oxidoreductase [Planctomycetes bacterium]|nr:Gfo/Idh/MocA family oxidoreductase [Planctomycetota bacterium]
MSPTFRRPVSRRRFLSRSLSGAAALGTFAAPTIRTTLASANERIGVAVIGFNGMGRGHIKRLAAMQNQAQVVRLCDLDPEVRARGAAILKEVSGETAPLCSEYERVLEDKSVDAVVIATPHHWHIPIALRALQAGKDVYCEKPASHVYNEGRLVVEAARKYGRVFQHGTQTRSMGVTAEARKVLASGVLGEIRMAKAWNVQDRGDLKPVPDSEPPEGVNYDRWLGPAAKRAFNRNRYHRNWRLFREYGNGDMGDDGVHDIDIARWLLQADGLPTRITAHGSTTFLGGEREYPDNMSVSFQYADGKVCLYEDRMYTPYGLHGWDSGNAFYGSEGYMIFSRRGYFQCYIGRKEEKGPGMQRREKRAELHMQNFLSCVRSRKETIATAEEAHRSCALVHLAEISFRVGRVLHFNPETETFKGDEAANALLTKDYRKPYGLPPQV